MYCRFKGGQIILWCVSKSSADCGNTKNRKRRRDSNSDTAGTGKHIEKENDVDEVYKQLKSKHGDQYEVPKLIKVME